MNEEDPSDRRMRNEYRNLVGRHYIMRFLGDAIEITNDPKFWVMRFVSSEKAPILFDEYETQFGERREEVIEEELYQERIIWPEHFTVGREFMSFVILSGPGTGKTSMLLYIHWRVSCHHDEVLEELESDTSTYYYSIENEPKYPPPRPLISIYVNAADLYRSLTTIQNLTEAIADAAWSTYLSGFKGMEEKEESEMEITASENEMDVSSESGELNFKVRLMQVIPKSRIVLLVDSLDSILPNLRPGLMSRLLQLQKDECEREENRLYFYRILIAARPTSLSKQRLQPKAVYLYLEPSVKTESEKLKFLQRVIRSKGNDMGIVLDIGNDPKLKKTLHHLKCPVTLSLLGKLYRNKIDFSPQFFALYRQFYELFGMQKEIGGWEQELRQQLISLVGFLYQCLMPYTIDIDSNVSFKDFMLRTFSSLLRSKVGVFGRIKLVSGNLLQDDFQSLVIWETLSKVLVDSSLCHCREDGDLYFVTNKMVFFLVAQFLSDVDFSNPLLIFFEESRLSPHIFSWKSNSTLANQQWDTVYDLLGSKMGVPWLVERTVKNLNEFLVNIRMEGGIDADDLGQLRFSMLLRTFSLHQLEQLLLKIPQSNQVFAMKHCFGAAYLTILEASASAIIHLEPFPTSSLVCFSEEHSQQIIQRCCSLLRRNGAFMIVDLLLTFEENGFLTEDLMQNIRGILTDDVRVRSKRPAVRFIKEYTLRQKGKKTMSKLLIEALGDYDEDVMEEANEGLKKLSEQSFELLKQEKEADSSGLTLEQGLLFPEQTWNLIFHSSLTLLGDLLTKKYHLTSSQTDRQLQSVANDKFFPACRVHQCKHLPYIISLAETPSPGSRLLLHVLLSDISPSDNFQKQSEQVKLQAVCTILETLNAVWKCQKPEAELINEVTKGNPLMQIVANIIAETLGPQAGECIILLEDLIKTKLDLLTHFTNWLWSVLPTETRRRAFLSLISQQDHLIRCHMIHLNSHEFVFDPIKDLAIDDNSVELILNGILRNPKETQLVLRQCLFFLDNVSKHSVHGSHQLMAVVACAALLDVYGFCDVFFSETLLRVVKEMIEQRKNLEEKKKIISTLEEYNVKGMILKYLQKKLRKPLWYGTVLVAEVLRYFVSPDKPEVDVFFAFLTTPEAQLRRVAVSVLKRSETRGMTIAENAFNLLLKEENPFIQRSIVQLLGLYGRKESLKENILGYVKKLISMKNCLNQELGISILGIMRLKDEPAISIITDILNESLSLPKLSNNHLILLVSTVNTVADVGIISPFVISSLLKVLSVVQNDELRVAIHLAFKQVVPMMPKEQILSLDSTLKTLLNSIEPPVRELTLKLFRVFKSEMVERCIGAILELTKDQQPFCRKHALKALEVLILDRKKRLSIQEFKETALEYMNILVAALRDTNAQVIFQALKMISLFKIKNLAETFNGTLDEDSFYVNQIIAPHVKTLTQILTTRKLTNNKDILVSLLIVLGETDHLKGCINAYKQILNSDQVSTLVEFAEALQTLGPRVLQYVPLLISHIQSPPSPLVRHLVRILQKYAKTMTAETCEKLFQTQTIVNMMKHRDPTVRRVAVQLMGKKCSQSQRNIWSVMEMWGDKNAKVKKEVMDVLGDLGKMNSEHFSVIMGSSFLEEVNSIAAWRNLSLAWHALVVKSRARENQENNSSNTDEVNCGSESSSSDE